MMRWQLGQRHQHLAQLAARVGAHGLHDVAVEGAILRPARVGQLAAVDAPDDLVGGRLDLVDLVDVLALAVGGEVEDAAPLRPQRPADREQHGVAEAAARQDHRFARRHLGRRAGRAHDHHRLARLEAHAEARAAAHLQDDQRQQPVWLVDPGAGERQPLHEEPRARAAGHLGQRFVVLQAEELPRLEVAGGGGRAHHHLDDGRVRRSTRDHRGAPARRRGARRTRSRPRRAPAAPAASSLAISSANSASTCGAAVLGRGHRAHHRPGVTRVVVAVVADRVPVPEVAGEEADAAAGVLQRQGAVGAAHGLEALEEPWRGDRSRTSQDAPARR